MIARYANATAEQIKHAIDVALEARHEWDRKPMRYRFSKV